MGTLSSLTGGSGGGGGDPTAKFQAAATIANGDLLVLNANGTVQPVTSNQQSANFSRSDNGSSIYGNLGNAVSTYASVLIHMGTRDEYVMIMRDGSSYLRYGVFTYSDSTGQFSSVSHSISVTYSQAWSVHVDQANQTIFVGMTNTSYYPQVFAIYHNGSQWTSTSTSGTLNQQQSTNCMYIGRSDDGTLVAAGCERTGNRVGTATLSYNNSGGTPTHTSSNMNNSAMRFQGSGMSGNVDLGGFFGHHVGGDRHVVHVRDTGDSFKSKLIAFRATPSGTTFGNAFETTFTTQNNYGSMTYDPVGNVGLVLYDNGSGTNAAPVTAFTVNNDLSITVHGKVATGYWYGAVGFNPTTKHFYVQSSRRDMNTFKLDSSGNKTEETSNVMVPSYNTPDMYYGALFPRVNSPFQVFSFNSGISVGGSYITNGSDVYGTQFHPAYLETDMDKHFGEAKEAISSGAAGSVGILNRSVDFIGSSFQEGQKLFANPSGTALATSGTYRVGHASDGDTVLVLGDPS